ncbi:MAG TPA: 5-carboxymethyl-2-hydroxymuconate Delta-isomerase [Noviherbaspirillum sp.]|jgi:5-carboxymethyl-2-hydroxymuconate isomerase|uniref:5-carboxymethyl-2-hydroxymuconate Delta-isomerase n=1 Tax=Noviherbaspirillum sp. TaxID=1926288 RepID=UPI002F956DDF
MPHLTLEYTANLDGFDPLPILRSLNRALAATGEFTEVDIKARARALHDFVIGTVEAQRGFVHAQLAILSGRDADTKKKVAGLMLEVLQSACPRVAGLSVQLCAEIVEIDRPSYAKSVVQDD